MRQKIKICSTKDALQRTENLNYGRLKIQKHLVRIDFSCSSFSFYEHFDRQFNYAMFFIFKTVKCV